MGEGSLSQDEINALLAGSATDNAGGNPSNPFSPQQLERLRELLSAAAKEAGSIMSGMAGQETSVTLEEVFASDKEELLPKLEDQLLDASAALSGGVAGEHYYIANASEAVQFGSLLVGQELAELDGAALSAYTELFSQWSAALESAISRLIGKSFKTGVTDSQQTAKGLSRMPATYFAAARYKAVYSGKSLEIYEIFDESAVTALTETEKAPAAAIPEAQQPAKEEPKPQPAAPVQAAQPKQQEPEKTGKNNKGAASSGAKPADSANSKHVPSLYTKQTPNVQGVQLPNLTGGNTSQEQKNISLLMDVAMELTVELGRTRWQIKDILSMGEGTIIELDKLAGEPVDILVNHNLIARGEVVVIDENFGVRVTEIVSSMDKLADRR